MSGVCVHTGRRGWRGQVTKAGLIRLLAGAVQDSLQAIELNRGWGGSGRCWGVGWGGLG